MITASTMIQLYCI